MSADPTKATRTRIALVLAAATLAVAAWLLLAVLTTTNLFRVVAAIAIALQLLATYGVLTTRWPANYTAASLGLMTTIVPTILGFASVGIAFLPAVILWAITWSRIMRTDGRGHPTEHTWPGLLIVVAGTPLTIVGLFALSAALR